MKSKYYLLKSKSIELRKLGKTYGEIQKIINENIPKSTLSTWFQKIHFTNKQKKKMAMIMNKSSMKGIRVARIVNQKRRKKYLKSIADRNRHLSLILNNTNVAKVVLSILYLAEGAKSLNRGSLYFGNSDPFVIDLFLSLMRKCYKIDESKFRCTVLCRSDQNIKSLEKFWLNITKIPKSQFYKTRIDPGTIGKPSKKLDYKGVCKIDYFSADLFLDLMQIPKTIHRGP